MNPGRIKESTDEELMVMYQQDSVKAFDELFLRHSGRVLGYFRKRWNPGQTITSPEDLLQNVFFKLHQGRSSYKKDYPFLPWLFSISHHVLVDAYRKNGRQEPFISLDFEPLAEEVARTDLWEELRKVLAPAEYELLKMRFEEGLSFELLADRTGKAPTALRKKVSRLLEKIRSKQILGEPRE